MHPVTIQKVRTYGYPDTHVPGSKYWREYCRECGEPIRVVHAGLVIWMGEFLAGDLLLCEHCSGWTRHHTKGGYSGPLDPDSGGYSANARMILEDG
jgi:hypothetical protein